MTEGYRSLQFTGEFLDSYSSREFSASERALIKKAMRLLDENESHPSLRIHALRRELSGYWSASASRSLRITFRRLADGRKLLITCSHHYDD